MWDIILVEVLLLFHLMNLQLLEVMHLLQLQQGMVLVLEAMLQHLFITYQHLEATMDLEFQLPPQHRQEFLLQLL